MKRSIVYLAVVVMFLFSSITFINAGKVNAANKTVNGKVEKKGNNNFWLMDVKEVKNGNKITLKIGNKEIKKLKFQLQNNYNLNNYNGSTINVTGDVVKRGKVYKIRNYTISE